MLNNLIEKTIIREICPQPPTICSYSGDFTATILSGAFRHWQVSGTKTSSTDSWVQTGNFGNNNALYPAINGHKYYMVCRMSGNASSTLNIGFGRYDIITVLSGSGDYCTPDKPIYVQFNSTASVNTNVNILWQSSTAIGTTVSSVNITYSIIDVTETFGEGNEPDYETCKLLFPNSKDYIYRPVSSYLYNKTEVDSEIASNLTNYINFTGGSAVKKFFTYSLNCDTSLSTKITFSALSGSSGINYSSAGLMFNNSNLIAFVIGVNQTTLKITGFSTSAIIGSVVTSYVINSDGTLTITVPSWNDFNIIYFSHGNKPFNITYTR